MVRCVYGSLDELHNHAEFSYGVCACKADEKVVAAQAKEHFNAEDCEGSRQHILKPYAEI